LACENVAGVIRGTIESVTGSYHDSGASIDLRLTKFEKTSSTQTPIDWSWREDRWTGEFVLADLPEREFTIALRAQPFAVRPEERVSVRPGERVEFTVLDGAPRVDVGFHVFEHGSRVELDECELRSTDVIQRFRSGDIVLRGVPEDGYVGWQIAKRGYVCSTGSLRMASASWTVDGSRRWVDVELTRGTRLSIHVLGPEYQPIDGASILVDGVEVGRTGARGELRFVPESYPTSIDVRYRDWHHVGWSRAVTSETLHPCGSVSFSLAP
jgi:hypothetical protein